MLGETAGLLYAADLLGGFFGGLSGGILLLPILGLKETCFIMAMLKISSGLLFLLFLKIHKTNKFQLAASGLHSYLLFLSRVESDTFPITR